MKEYIEREVTMKMIEFSMCLDEIVDKCDYFDGQIAAKKNMLDIIERSVPAADVVPIVHGEWKMCCEEPRLTSTSAGVSKFWFECSLCGRREPQKEPYCHCGAKMDGGK